MENQDINNKKFLRGILVILLLFAVSVELPNLDKSIIQLMIPNFIYRNSDGQSSVWYLSGIVSLVILLFGIGTISMSRKFNVHAIAIFFLVSYIALPLMFKSVEAIESIFYKYQTGVKSIKMVDSNINIHDWNDYYEVLFSFEIKSDKDITPNEITLVLPVEHEGIYKDSTFELQDGMWSYSDGVLLYRQSIKLELIEDVDDKLLRTIKDDYYNYTIVLRYDGEKAVYIRNDSY